MDLCIWFENGNYAYFTGVKDLLVQDEALIFGYFGRDSKKAKDAKFYLARIAGYSISKEGLTG